jgi:hypothetical protein
MPSTGSTSHRGYGNAHRKLRKQWEPRVSSGTVNCWRCGQLIQRREPWDLGHDDADRTKYRGPEHIKCNRSHGAGQPPPGRWVRADW